MPKSRPTQTQQWVDELFRLLLQFQQTKDTSLLVEIEAKASALRALNFTPTYHPRQRILLVMSPNSPTQIRRDDKVAPLRKEVN